MQSLIHTLPAFDRFTDRVLAVLDDFTRGHCQEPSCYERAEISDTHTSLAFCGKHYYQLQGRRNLRIIRKADRGI